MRIFKIFGDECQCFGNKFKVVLLSNQFDMTTFMKLEISELMEAVHYPTDVSILMPHENIILKTELTPFMKLAADKVVKH